MFQINTEKLKQQYLKIRLEEIISAKPLALSRMDFAKLERVYNLTKSQILWLKQWNDTPAHFSIRIMTIKQEYQKAHLCQQELLSQLNLFHWLPALYVSPDSIHRSFMTWFLNDSVLFPWTALTKLSSDSAISASPTASSQMTSPPSATGLSLGFFATHKHRLPSPLTTPPYFPLIVRQPPVNTGKSQPLKAKTGRLSSAIEPEALNETINPKRLKTQPEKTINEAQQALPHELVQRPTSALDASSTSSITSSLTTESAVSCRDSINVSASPDVKIGPKSTSLGGETIPSYTQLSPGFFNGLCQFFTKPPRTQARPNLGQQPDLQNPPYLKERTTVKTEGSSDTMTMP